MSVTIAYSSIITRITTLSSYEARLAVDSQGRSMYPEVHVTDSDAAAMKEYIKQGMKRIEALIAGALNMETEFDVSITEGQTVVQAAGMTIDISSTLSDAGGGTTTKAFQQSLIETLVCFAMSMWLGNKIPERSKSYEGMFQEMLAATKKIALTKRKPQLG